MPLNRNKLYSILFIACVAGYIWIYIDLKAINNPADSVGVCLVKNATNIPCPSCGSTRSVISLLKGNFKDAFFLNPFGYLVAFIMIITPIWIVFDVVTKKKILFEFYKKIETYLKKPQWAIPLILLVIFNWIWNITKGL